METGQTVQESVLHAGRRAWWPLDTMACNLDDASTISSFLLGWDPQLCCFGLGAMGAGAGDSGTHARELELFVPKCRSRSFISIPCMELVSMDHGGNSLIVPMCARHGVSGVRGVNSSGHRLDVAEGRDGDARGAG